MVVNGRPLKRMKRRITVDLNDFLTFPATDDVFSGDYDGPFRSNVQNFLTKYAQLPPPSSLFPHLLNWQIVLKIGELTDGSTDSSPAVVTLDVLEEDVTRSRSVYCDQCRVVGWSGHPVCGKRYHFIIRTGDSSIEGYHKPCPSCGDVLHLSESSCKSCNYVVSSEELEEWVQLQLESTTHLLHGVVHGNGYGHLLRVNGREGGSKYLSGCDIMNFWDRICTTLRVRKISVMDVSKKYGMEYRLVHAVTNGHPWYGNWGYEFGYGSFALTLDAYQKAVDDISNIPLSLFFSQARNCRTHLQDIISFYQSLSDSELLTTRDLFCFLMRQIRHDLSSSAVSASKKPGSFSSWTLCSWTIDDVNRVEEGMIKVLQAVGMYRWVSWRSLKGALYRTASPELLDYCLKQLGGKIVGDAMIHARCNTEKNLFEYRLVPSCGTLSDEVTLKNCPTVDQLLGDLKFLYDSLLNPQTMINYRPNKTRDRALCSAAKLLDCKHFVKNYKPEEIPVRNPFVVRLSCEVELVDHPKDYTAPPSELILLPCNSTLTEMKTEATKAFQDVYVIFKRFQVENVIQCPTNGLIRVCGRCHDKHGLDQFRMERGIENWTVSCSCGAKDDDGERMLACDSCGVWQHTRCAGINDIDAVPESFICRRCDSPMKEASKSDSPMKEASKIDPSECVSRACKEMGAQVIVPGSCRIGGKKLLVPFGVS